jgi:hypothetical protein
MIKWLAAGILMVVKALSDGSPYKRIRIRPVENDTGPKNIFLYDRLLRFDIAMGEENTGEVT